MRITLKAIFIIILGLIVGTVGLIFIMSGFSESGEQTKGFWNISSHIFKNASEKAQEKTEGAKLCKDLGERCSSTSECCEDLVCRKESSNSQRYCLKCGTGDLVAGKGDYCETNSDCCAGYSCHNAGSSNAYCA